MTTNYMITVGNYIKFETIIRMFDPCGQLNLKNTRVYMSYI